MVSHWKGTREVVGGCAELWFYSEIVQHSRLVIGTSSQDPIYLSIYLSIHSRGLNAISTDPYILPFFYSTLRRYFSDRLTNKDVRELLSFTRGEFLDFRCKFVDFAGDAGTFSFYTCIYLYIKP